MAASHGSMGEPKISAEGLPQGEPKDKAPGAREEQYRGRCPI